MDLISEEERVRILDEARRQPSNRTRMDDPNWAMGIVFSTLGLIMILSSLGELTDSRIDVLAANGIAFLLLGLYDWGRWQRRKVLCVLHNLLVRHDDPAATAGAAFATPRWPLTVRFRLSAVFVVLTIAAIVSFVAPSGFHFTSASWRNTVDCSPRSPRSGARAQGCGCSARMISNGC
jgi:hypothetical protein